MRNKNARSILQSKGALGGGHIFFKGCLWLLDNADVIAIPNKNVVDTFPAGAVGPGAVNQNNVTNAMRFVLR